MKLIYFTDLHFHDWVSKTHPEGRLPDMTQIIHKVFVEAAKNSAKYILFSGDILHIASSVRHSVWLELINSLTYHFEATDDITILACSGNHDLDSAAIHGKPYNSAIDILASTFPRFINIDNTCSVYVDGDDEVTIAAVPYYRHRSSWVKAANKLKAGINKFNMKPDFTMTHQMIEGMIKPDVYLDDIPAEFGYILNGHDHVPKLLNKSKWKPVKGADIFYKKKHSKILNGGAPMQYHMGDAGNDNFIYIIDTAEGVISPMAMSELPKFVKLSEKSSVKENDILLPEAVVIKADIMDYDFNSSLDTAKLVENYCKNLELDDDYVDVGKSCL